MPLPFSHPVEYHPEPIVVYEMKQKNQYLATFAATLGAIIVGTLLGWTSPVNPQLMPAKNVTEKSDELINSLGQPATFLLTTTEISIVSSILAVGAAVAALPVGVLVQKIGRRPTILLLNVPFMICWLLTIFATGANMLIAARFIGGIGFGGISVACPIYIGEIADASIRGYLGSFFQLGVTFGILFAYVVGGWRHWKSLSIICSVLVPVMVVVFWCMPETPQYLLGKDRKIDAEKSLKWLRGSHMNLESELQEIRQEIDKAATQKKGIKSLLTSRGPRKALICAVGLMFFQQLSGVNVVVFYTHDIFRSAGSNVPSAVATIIVGLVMFLATYVSSMMVDKAGRKLLLHYSCLVMGLTLIALGVYFYLQSKQYNVSCISWLPLVSLVLYVIFFSIGYGPIPWIMMAEMFPMDLRGAATGITVITNLILVFVVTLSFPIMKDMFGIHQCFWFFAAIMGLSVIFIWLLVPETKGKSLAQIQAALAGVDG